VAAQNVKRVAVLVQLIAFTETPRYCEDVSGTETKVIHYSILERSNECPVGKTYIPASNNIEEEELGQSNESPFVDIVDNGLGGIVDVFRDRGSRRVPTTSAAPSGRCFFGVHVILHGSSQYMPL
jgi:hypothetical protein